MSNRVCHFKLVLLGDAAVGKSCLVVRFVRDEFFEFQEPTIGGKLHHHLFTHSFYWFLEDCESSFWSRKMGSSRVPHPLSLVLLCPCHLPTHVAGDTIPIDSILHSTHTVHGKPQTLALTLIFFETPNHSPPTSHRFRTITQSSW